MSTKKGGVFSVRRNGLEWEGVGMENGVDGGNTVYGPGDGEVN